MVLASDTHLRASDPDGIRRFLRFVQGPCSGAEQVVLVGDLFDFWVSGAQRDDPGLDPVFRALESLVDRGVDVGFVEGNRDFEAGRDLSRLGVRRLADVLVVSSGDKRVVITHGDLLCTKDVRYQAFRRLVRSSVVRHLLRSVPHRVAMGLGRGARAGSALETGSKYQGDMALAPLAVTALLRSHDADALVCGHVHWGQWFRVDVDAVPRDVVVLSAWEQRGSYAVVDDGRIEFRWFE